jgi:hypothetical protein
MRTIDKVKLPEPFTVVYDEIDNADVPCYSSIQMLAMHEQGRLAGLEESQYLCEQLSRRACDADECADSIAELITKGKAPDEPNSGNPFPQPDPDQRCHSPPLPSSRDALVRFNEWRTPRGVENTQSNRRLWVAGFKAGRGC